jgi:hypothetical protein
MDMKPMLARIAATATLTDMTVRRTAARHGVPEPILARIAATAMRTNLTDRTTAARYGVPNYSTGMHSNYQQCYPDLALTVEQNRACSRKYKKHRQLLNSTLL